ncbi:MAG: hypothetical protein Q8P12_02675 [bacterium]|nr:hypothetical protein [bacterium]
MNFLRLIKDSRGNPSWAHSLAIPCSLAITVWFLTGGVDITVGSYHILTATKGAAEYALAVGVWLAFLGQREYVSKTKPSGNGGSSNGN